MMIEEEINIMVDKQDLEDIYEQQVKKYNRIHRLLRGEKERRKREQIAHRCGNIKKNLSLINDKIANIHAD